MSKETAGYVDAFRETLDQNFFSLLGDFTDTEKTALIEQLEFINLKKQEILFHQHDDADGIYLLLSGKLEALVLQPDGTQMVVGYVNRSETVGEMALITDDKRSATVRCFRNSVLAKMNNELFLKLCYENPEFALNVSKIVVKRLKTSIGSQKKKVSKTNIALVADKNDSKATRAVRELRKELEQNEKIHLIDEQTIRREFQLESSDEFDQIQEHELDSYLSELELNYDRLVFDLSAVPVSGITRLLDYTDICLFFTGVETDQIDLTDFERYFFTKNEEILFKTKTVFCYSEETSTPTQTRARLELRKQVPHFNIRSGNQADTNRIQRFLLQKTNGFVLGGGGAKGLAHLGVLRALEEAEIPVDYICGTSIGAIMGFLYAKLQNVEEVIQISQRVFKGRGNPTPRHDLNIYPKHSIYRGRKINSQLSKHIGNYDIEDLWLPFFCISSNITKPEMVIHESGDAKTAIRASMSVPGLFPPVILNNNVHVDGGVFNNMPIDVMMNREVDVVIACRVDKEYIVATEKEVVRSLPGLFTTFIKSTVANSDSHSEGLEQFVNLFFAPDVVGFGLLDWKSHDAIMMEGYNHARRVISEHQNLADMKL